MTSDQPVRGLGEPAAVLRYAARQTRPAADLEQNRDGGDPACWACLVCQECGAVVSEGHRAGCSHVSHPAGPLRADS